MTPQIKLVGIGLVTFVIAKFYLKKETQQALLYGATAISTIAVLTAHTHSSNHE